MVAGAHRDALFAEQVGEIGDVHTVDAEAGQRRLRFAEQADAVARQQAGEQAGVEGSFVGGDFGFVQGGQPVDGRAQADRRGNRRGARLEAERAAWKLASWKPVWRTISPPNCQCASCSRACGRPQSTPMPSGP